MTLQEKNTSRAALLPERLKRKQQNVKKREQNENLPAQLRTSQPWRPGGSACAVVGVHAQQDRPVLSQQQQPSVLTSTFSVRDSLQSLRSSRVFKQAQEPVEPPKPEQLPKQHVKPAVSARDRPVLQPLSTQHRVGANSRASSCGSNSAVQAQPLHMSSCSSLDSAVNQVLSPTDEGERYAIAGPGRSAQAAESKQSLPAAVSTSLRIPQVADSCCELLQLLQMEEESPTCSRAASSSCETPAPLRPAQAPVQSQFRPAAAAAVASKPAVRSQPAARSTLPPQAQTAAGKAVSRAAAVAVPVGKGVQAAPKPRARVGSAAPVLPSRVAAAAAGAVKLQRRRVGEAAGSGAGAAAKAGHGLSLRAAPAGAAKQHVEQRQTAAAARQPVGTLGAALQQQRAHRVEQQPAAQEAAVCPPLSLALSEQSKVTQPQQVQPEAPEIVDMRNKLLAMQQQLAALQQQVGQRPAVQPAAAAAAAQEPPPPTAGQQQQHLQEEAGAAGGDSGLQGAMLLQEGSDPQQQQGSGNTDSSAACAGAVVQTQGMLPPSQMQQEQQQDADQWAAPAEAELQMQQQGDCPKEQHQEPGQQQRQQEAVHDPDEQQQQQQQENVGQQQPPVFQQQQQQPSFRHFGAAMTNSQLQQQQQQSSTYHKLLQATRALVDNSHWQATSLQMRHGGPSPLKAGCSSGRLGSGLGRSAAAGGGVLGGSPALSRQLSRLSVSQSWGGASPGPTPRPGAAPAALPQLDTRAGVSAAGLGKAVRARLFGLALGAVSEALLASQSPAAADKAVSSLGAGCAGIANLLPQPALTACSSPFHSGAFSSRGPSAAAGAAAHSSILPPLSPAGRSSSRSVMLCTSRVAQVLYGTPSKQPAGLLTGDAAGQQHGTGAGGRSSSSMAAAEGGACSPGAAGCRHVGETASLSCSGVASQLDSDDETESRRQPRGDVHQAPGQQGRSAGVKQPGQQAVGLTGSYEQQQEAQEMWTVHTNWAADLDAETAAVAAAAAAAAGLSAHLGRGHAVRLQDHSSPFNPAQLTCTGSVHGSQAGCSPMWVSVGAAQQQQSSHAEAGASPVSLRVPRKLWSSPPLAGAAGE